MSESLQLKVTPEFMKLLSTAVDNEASMAAKVPSKMMWLNSSKEGKLFLARLMDDISHHKYPGATNAVLNKMIHDEYVKVTGGLKRGRPKLSEARIEVITKALELYLRPAPANIVALHTA